MSIKLLLGVFRSLLRLGDPRVFLVCLALFLAATPTSANDAPADTFRPVVVGYLPSYRLEKWRPTRNSPLTDIIFFSNILNSDGRLKADPIESTHLTRLQAIQKETKCRVLICIGGAGQSDGLFQVATDSDLRSRFINSLLDLCQTHGFDGIDYDWEHPRNAEELAAYAELLEETKSAFSRPGLLVTVAQAPWQDIGSQAYAAVDRVHLMSYDHEYPQATLEKADRDIKQILKWGCPRHKVVLGVPFYGRDSKRRARSYAQLALDHELEQNQDSVDGFAFNGFSTINAKARLVTEKQLGGIMIWELGQDIHNPTKSLLGAIAIELGRIERTAIGRDRSDKRRQDK